MTRADVPDGFLDSTAAAAFLGFRTVNAFYIYASREQLPRKYRRGTPIYSKQVLLDSLDKLNGKSHQEGA